MSTTKKNTTTSKRKNKEKGKPKNPIKFEIQLNEEQKKAKALLLENDVIVLSGKPGSGKTLLAVQSALDAFFNRKINNIHITRPTVSKEDIGFLPGDLKEKMDPWLTPIYHNMYMCYKKNKIDSMFEDGDIVISPISFMRGITFVDSYIIVDECQNITIEQMKMIITRLGKESTLIFCGDSDQIDLRNKHNSGLNYLIECGANVKGFCHIELKENHRHSIVDLFLDEFEKQDNETKKK